MIQFSDLSAEVSVIAATEGNLSNSTATVVESPTPSAGTEPTPYTATEPTRADTSPTPSAGTSSSGTSRKRLGNTSHIRSEYYLPCKLCHWKSSLVFHYVTSFKKPLDTPKLHQ